MRLLTLNTHSLVEPDYDSKLQIFIEAIKEMRPDVIALQEVNQTSGKRKLSDAEAPGRVLNGYEQKEISEDNHVAKVAAALCQAGLMYYWTWLPMKLGYGVYDEGLAIMSRRPIARTDVELLSRTSSYNDWRCRYLLGIQHSGSDDWYYSTHLGWWDDEKEPFKEQWQRLEKHIGKKKEHSRVFLLGDFNSPAQVRGEGYDLIKANGWLDTYGMAAAKDDGITVPGIIDGWREKLAETESAEGMRIDQIWCSSSLAVKSSRVCFDGRREAVVSDHFGILVEIEDS